MMLRPAMRTPKVRAHTFPKNRREPALSACATPGVRLDMIARLGAQGVVRMRAAEPTPAPTAPPSADLSASTYRMARRVWATTVVRGALFLIVGMIMALWPHVAIGLIK